MYGFIFVEAYLLLNQLIKLVALPIKENIFIYMILEDLKHLLGDVGNVTIKDLWECFHVQILAVKVKENPMNNQVYRLLFGMTHGFISLKLYLL